MKFLIITQDLRVSGTSQGIIERSFLAKLRIAYPDAVIDVLYLKNHLSDDDLHLLPVNSIETYILDLKIPFLIKWINRITSRLFNILYAENYLHNQFAKEIRKIDYTIYDHIMVRSAGLAHETLLAMHNLPILKRATVNFHDPYPLAWYLGNPDKINKNEIKRLQKMIQVVQQSKACCASAYYMAKDLQYLFASNKVFYTLPHQFDYSVFDLSDTKMVRKKEKKIQISYHGALMFGRDIFSIVEAFREICTENDWIKENVEFILRVKGAGLQELKKIADTFKNIIVLDTLNFSNSSNEQIHESDINIILENGPYYCNILGGKAPFLFSFNSKVLISSPERSELRRVLDNYEYVFEMNNLDAAKEILLKVLIFKKEKTKNDFQYFSDNFFKKSMDNIIAATT